MEIGKRCYKCNEFFNEEFMRGSYCYDCSEETENPFEEDDEDSYE